MVLIEGNIQSKHQHTLFGELLLMHGAVPENLLAKLHCVWWQLLKQQLPAFMPTNSDRAFPVLPLQLFYTLICVLCCADHFASDVAVNLLMDQYTLRGEPTWASKLSLAMHINWLPKERSAD